jgi:adenine deaminase
LAQNYLALVHDLQNQLEILQTAIAAQLEPAPAIAKDWLRSHREVQAFFQSNLVNTNLEITPQNLSLQVEIDKQLKMLGVDLSMLQTARSSATWQKRHKQACDRFVLLDRYFQMH